MFKELTIKNFRGISSLALKDFQSVNLFVGVNNSSKTSVLEALFLSIGVSNPQLAIVIDSFREFNHDDPDDFRFIFHNLEYSNAPVLEVSFDDNSNRVLNIKPILTDKVVEGVETATNAKTGKRAVGLTFECVIKAYHSRGITYKSTIEFKAGILNVTPASNYKENVLGVFIPSAQRFRVELAKRLGTIILNKEKEQIIETLKLADPDIKDITIGVGNMIYIDVGLNQYIPINLEGEGLNRLLSFIVTIYFNKNGVVFIDEIENGFHYSIFESVWRAILGAAKKYNVQLFITSHNYEILQSLGNTAESFQDIAAFTLIRTSRGSVESVRYGYDQFENAMQKKLEIR